MEKDITNIIEKLKERFPLFLFKQRGDYLEVAISHTSTRNIHLEKINSEEILTTLQGEHNEKKWAIELNQLYPNLYFSKYGMWTVKGSAKEKAQSAFSAVLLSKEFDFFNPDHELLSKLNKAAEKSVMEKDWFFCSACLESKEFKEFAGSVFMARYCKVCESKDPGIKNLIKEAEKPGFYD